MKKIFLFSLLPTLLLCQSIVFSQNKSVPQNVPVLQQFDFVVKESNSFEEYKVIRKTWLNSLKISLTDSITNLKSDLKAIKNESASQLAEITSAKKEIAQLNSQLQSLTNEKDSISFLGMDMSKTGYQGLMWFLIGLLTLVGLVFAYKFKNANLVTVYAKKELKNLETEFEEYRKKAIEREQKARRQLQDEINKQRSTKTAR